MREIKFRGQRVDGGGVVYGSLITTKTKTYICNQFANDLEHQDEDVCLIDGISEVIPETVGQYIGKKDKNGKEIYEGDKVSNPHDSEPFYIVEWDEENAGFTLGNGDSVGRYGFSTYWTVIGNVHETPEPEANNDS